MVLEEFSKVFAVLEHVYFTGFYIRSGRKRLSFAIFSKMRVKQ